MKTSRMQRLQYVHGHAEKSIEFLCRRIEGTLGPHCPADEADVITYVTKKKERRGEGGAGEVDSDR